MYETEHDDDVAVLAAVIETAAGMFNSDGVIRLLCELTDSRKTAARLSSELYDHNTELERLLEAADHTEAQYHGILAQRMEEIDRLRAEYNELDERYSKFRRESQPDYAVTAMAQGKAVAAAVDAYNVRNGKIDMIKMFRQRTGTGLLEAKLICEQIIAAIEAAKEATVE